MRRRVLCLLVTVVAVAFCWLRSYEVTPTQASWSGWVPQNGYIGETFTANFDSITEVQFFAGSLGASPSTPFEVEVRDYVTNDRVAYNDGVAAAREHSWVKFPMTTPSGTKFVRGRQYILKVTRPGDSINYYYSHGDPYQYGRIWTGGGLGPTDEDLCLRIYGKARVGDEFSMQSVVGFCSGNNVGDTWGWRDLIQSEAVLGTKSDKLGYGFTPWLNPDSGVYNWGMMDSLVTHFAGESIAMPVVVGPGPWANSGWRAITRGLFEPVLAGGQINDANPVARFMYDFARRYGPRGEFWQSHQGLHYLPIELYETPPEPTTHSALGNGDSSGTWQVGNLTDTPYIDTLKHHIHLHNYSPDSVYLGRKSSFMHVYSRYVIVQDSALELAAASLFVPEESVPRNAAYCICMPPSEWGPGEHFYPGEWLDGYRQYGVGPFFDVASYHPYHSVAYQEPLIRDTFRYYFSHGGWFTPRPFWASEAGHFGYALSQGEFDTLWPLKVTETYATIQAVNARPAYPVEQWTWYTYTARIVEDYYDTVIHQWVMQSITDSEFSPRPPAYAYKQWSDMCQGSSFEGRLPAYGSTNPDETLWVHVHQYRDSMGKRFWLAWEDLGWPYGDRTFKLPARADTQSVCGVDYDGSPPTNSEAAEPTGWFAREFDTFPVIVREGENFSRPDIVVDSLKLVPSPLVIAAPATAHVYFHNAVSVPVPEGPMTGHHYTWVVLRHNGDSVAQAFYDSQLYPPNNSGSVTISIGTVPANWRGTALFDATANYGQAYVELNGMDDNDGYSRNRVTNLAQVDSPAVACGSHHNEPLVPLGLRTFSIERDTTGQTPCDSARVAQYFFGVDTVVHAADTSEWFCLNPASTTFDTSLQFLFGPGKYRLLVQAKDSWTESELVPDSAHTYVYFDTTGPSGSVVINGGDRFATSSTCTLALAASDSASGVCNMRFMNVPKADLVVGGSFTATAGSWQYANSEVDTLLHMARLTAAPVGAMVRQFIPAESISAHAGDSCALEASILAHVHEDSASGCASFWYYCTRVDSLSFHDTLFTLVDSVRFSGNLLSLTGRYNLSKRFVLSPPSSDSEWVWKGGMVKVIANSENGTGSVWTDNVALNTFAPESGYVWWGQYDTLAVWDITSGAGMKVVRALFMDSAGNVNATPCADTIILDPTAPVVDISVPGPGQLVNGTVEITG
jgi:hypothetical protein